jgi:hypothetical protein
MKIALPDFRIATAWIPEQFAHFVRHYTTELSVALALALVAAHIIAPVWSKRERRLKEQAIQTDIKAVATL